MTLFVIVGALFLPESPKFYLSKQRWEDARTSLNYIAKFNGCEAFNGKFDREIVTRRGEPSFNKPANLNAT